MFNSLEEVLNKTGEIKAYLIGGVAINSYIEGSRYKVVRPPSPSNDIDFASAYTSIEGLNKIAGKFDGKISLLISESKINYTMYGIIGKVVYDTAPVLTLNQRLNNKDIQIFPDFVGPIKVDKDYKSNGLLRVANLDTLIATQLNPMAFDANRLRKIDIAVAAECERKDEPLEFASKTYYSGAKKICRAIDDVEKVTGETYKLLNNVEMEDLTLVSSQINNKSYSHDGYIDSMKKTANELKNLKTKENKIIGKYSINNVGNAVEHGLELFYEEIKGL